MAFQPDPKEYSQIKSRTLWIMLSLSVIFVSVYIAVDFFNTKKGLELEQQTSSQQVAQLFQAETQRLDTFFSTRVKCHLATPQAVTAMQNRDHEMIYKFAKPKYDVLQSRNPHVTHMHFYGPDGVSLMRVHNKDVYGDKISEKRPMVEHAVNNQASVTGFEEGYFGLIYRIVEPAYNRDGEYIGSLEFGLQPQYFEGVIKDLYPDMKVAMAIPKKNLSIYRDTGKFETFNNHYVLGSDLELLKPYIGTEVGSKPDAVVVDGRNHILIDDIVLTDFTGNPFIKMYLLKDVQSLEDKFIQNVIFSLIMGLVLLAVFWLASRIALNYFSKNVLLLGKELHESHAKMESVFNTTREGLAVLNEEGRFVEVNKAFAQIVGYPLEELIQSSYQEVFKDSLSIDKYWQRGKSSEKLTELHEFSYITPDGDKKVIDVTFGLMQDLELGLLTCRDITVLHNQKREIESYVNVVDEHVITSKTDTAGFITYVSQAFCDVSGYSREELIGKRHSIVKHADMDVAVYKDLWDTITQGKTWQGELKNLNKDGSEYWVSASISPEFDSKGNIVGYTAIRHDVSDKKRVEILSITDELTGLYNRRYYNEMFAGELARHKREAIPFLFVLIDIDNFKRYNDNYGHLAGDKALIEFSQCLKGCFKRSGDILFRMGGEEFGAILHIKNAEEAEFTVEKVHKALKDLDIKHADNQPYGYFTVSAGACLIADYKHSYVEKEIYKLADEALYKAKAEGRNKTVLTVL